MLAHRSGHAYVTREAMLRPPWMTLTSSPALLDLIVAREYGCVTGSTSGGERSPLTNLPFLKQLTSEKKQTKGISHLIVIIYFGIDMLEQMDKHRSGEGPNPTANQP